MPDLHPLDKLRSPHADLESEPGALTEQRCPCGQGRPALLATDRRVLADPSDGLTEQIGVPGVPAVLLDQVAEEPAQAGAAAVGRRDVDQLVGSAIADGASSLPQTTAQGLRQGFPKRSASDDCRVDRRERIMSTMLEFDAEASRKVEAVYTTRDVVEQRRAVLEMLAIRPGESVLDIGTGPGFLAAEIAAAAGPTGQVCGIDISDSMLALARARMPTDQAPVELRHGEAVRIPYPDASFDVAVSTQVLEYVADIATALSEIHRVLRPGGRVLILDTDWDSIVWHSNDERRMDRVLAIWEQHLADPHLPRTLRRGLELAGLVPTDAA